ncbi:MAG: hypothetical protein WCV59_02890 [Parcubacteria group bacterium]|jgi:hypothetical protein
MSQKISSLLDGLSKKWLLREDDDTWKKWVDFKSRDREDLIDLLSANIRDTLKARALFLLLILVDRWNTIYWKGEIGVFRKAGFFKDLSPVLANLAVMLLRTFLDATAEKIEGVSRHEIGSARNYYNDSLLSVLSALPEKEALKVFESYSFNDLVSPWCDTESCSGYKPLKTLFFRSDVDVKWKLLAHEKMQQIIADEVSGKALPRTSWETALPHYIEVVQQQLYLRRGLNYPTELFADQIRLVTDETHYGKASIELRHLPQIITLLAGDSYRDIRCQLYRFILLGNAQEFQIWDESLFHSAKLMLDELGEGDSNITKRLQSAIDDWQKKGRENKDRQFEARRDEESVLSQMR